MEVVQPDRSRIYGVGSAGQSQASRGSTRSTSTSAVSQQLYSTQMERLPQHALRTPEVPGSLRRLGQPEHRVHGVRVGVERELEVKVALAFDDRGVADGELRSSPVPGRTGGIRQGERSREDDAQPLAL